MLTGDFKHSIDQKNRIFMPAKLREELGDTFMIAPDLHRDCLKVFSMKDWEDYIEPYRQLPRELSENVLRYLHSNGAQVTADAQGRVVLTPVLIKHAAIEKNAVVLGCGNYAEIWSEGNFVELKATESRESLRDQLKGFGL